jgi:hypothetical protein
MWSPDLASAMTRAWPAHVQRVQQFHSLASFLTYCLGIVRSDVALLDAPVSASPKRCLNSTMTTWS